LVLVLVAVYVGVRVLVGVCVLVRVCVLVCVCDGVLVLVLAIALGHWLKKTLEQFMSENVLPIFSSRNFMVSCLIFRFLSHFELIFV